MELLNVSEKYGLPTLIGGILIYHILNYPMVLKNFTKFESVNQELKKEIKTFQSDFQVHK